MTVVPFALAVACSLHVTASFANDADDYRRRGAENDVSMFDAHDRDKDERLTVEEAHGNVDLEARFDDFDIDRDAVITRDELNRYIRLQYGIASTTN